ncbi:MAG: saccharopine dehydrogenase NADP-binding domain-containing protein [Bacteroidota bacterium]
MTKLLIYGAYGYSGRLIVAEAVRKGMRPFVAGRNEAKTKALADQYDLPWEAFSLDETDKMDAALREMDAILHCAGPFVHTCDLVAEACFRTQTHYLDITGEVAVFEWMARHDKQAQAAGIMLLPGTGFDVVPTDCLAAHLKDLLPSATHLTLAFEALAGLSHGTATTAVENLGEGGMIRKDGTLERVPSAHATRKIVFADKPRTCVAIPWGDISTAYHSTEIPNITVFVSQPPKMIRMMKITRYLGWLLGSSPVQSYLKKRIKSGPAGPSDAKRDAAVSLVWGEAKDDKGNSVEARLTTPNGYTLTASASVHIAQKVLNGEAKAGFMTPSLAFGKNLVTELEGVDGFR